MDSLVSTGWLAAALGADDLVVVDASYHLGDTGRDAAAEHDAGHIPGAVFLDLATLVDPAATIDNTLPSADFFAARMGSLGIGDGRRIVVYDDSAIKSATRAWFMLTMFGAGDVAILDGGLGKWRAEGRSLEKGRNTAPEADRTATANCARTRTKREMIDTLVRKNEGLVRKNDRLVSGNDQIVDARSAGRFTGAEPETRPGIASGHIPGSRNLHYAKLYQADGTLKDTGALQAAFAEAGVDLARPVVATCGSGMTACVLAFALHRLGKDDVALYDGSWSEWGADPATPKATGPA